VIFCQVPKPPCFDSATIQALLPLLFLLQLPSINFSCSCPPMLLLEVKHEVLTQLQLLSGRWCLLCWLVIFCQVPKPQLFDSAISFQCLALCIKTSRETLQMASVQRFKTVVLMHVWLLSGIRCLLCCLVIFIKFQSHHSLILLSSFGVSLSASRHQGTLFRWCQCKGLRQ